MDARRKQASFAQRQQKNLPSALLNGFNALGRPADFSDPVASTFLLHRRCDYSEDCRCGFHLDGGRVALVALHLRQKFANAQCFVSVGVHISTSNRFACFLGRHISWWLQSTAENHHLALSTTPLSYFWTTWDFDFFFFSSTR